MKIKRSIISFIALLLINLVISSTLATKYMNTNFYEKESTLVFLEDKITKTFERLFFNIQLAESLARVGYEKFDQKELDILLAPIIEDESVINVSILPDGIVKYVHPMAGNEKAIGDNVFEMPNRKKEAELAKELKLPILCGPYELTQGGTGLIMRKAIFNENEHGEEEFWGLVAVVMNAEEIFKDLYFDEIEKAGYAFELSSNLYTCEPTLIQKKGNFNPDRAMYTTISFPNGMWVIGISKNIDYTQIISVAIVFIFGLLLSIARFKELRKKERELENIKNEILMDNLTGLYNRKRLDAFERKLIHDSIPFTIFFIDLNDFKLINDTYGHDFGDRLLISIANKFTSIIRESDLAIRIGGDEFIVILTGVVKPETMTDFCSRLDKIQQEKIILDDIEIKPSLSYGFASYPKDAQSLEDIMQCADARMYANKKQQKDNKQ